MANTTDESSRILHDYSTTIKRRFPTLLSSFDNLQDGRKKKANATGQLKS